MFRGLTKKKRCIVPASGFYEWRQTGGRKQPYYITSHDCELWGFAGLYDETHAEGNDAAGSFTIITTSANPLLSSLHERMPVILRREDEGDWISTDLENPHEVEQFLLPYPDEEMQFYPVSTAVNNTRNNSPELIEPEGPVDQT
jgi:putative SOS response-associated peptidase YedK